jgi:hypothetical protein
MKTQPNYWINNTTGRYFKEIKGMPRKLCLSQVDGTASGMLVFDSENEAHDKGYKKTDSLKEFLAKKTSIEFGE